MNGHTTPSRWWTPAPLALACVAGAQPEDAVHVVLPPAPLRSWEWRRERVFAGGCRAEQSTYTLAPTTYLDSWARQLLAGVGRDQCRDWAREGPISARVVVLGDPRDRARLGDQAAVALLAALPRNGVE